MEEGGLRSISSRLLSGSAWAFSAKLLAAASGFAVNALLARLLSPEEMGAYFLIFSVVAFAALIAQFGMKRTVVRLVAESLGHDRPDVAKGVIRSVLIVGALGSALVSLIYYGGVGDFVSLRFFNSELMQAANGVAAIWIVVLAFQTLLSEIFRGLHDIRYASIFGGLTTSIISTLIFSFVWLVYGRAELDQLILLVILSGLASIILASVLLKKQVRAIEGKIEQCPFDKLSRVGMPLFFNDVLMYAIMEGHIWILGVFRPEDEVAIYGAASRLINLVALPLLILNNVIPPMIAEYYAKGKMVEVEKILRVTATVAGIPAMIALGFFVVFGEEILGLVFGEFYAQGFFVLVALGVGKIINVLTGSPGVMMVMADKQNQFLKYTVISGVIGVALSVLLVGKFGGVGVAIGVSFGVFLLNILMWLYCWKKLEIKTHMGLSGLVYLKSLIAGGARAG